MIKFSRIRYDYSELTVIYLCSEVKYWTRRLNSKRAFMHTRHSFWARHSKRLALGPIVLGTVRLIYTAKHVQDFSMLISETATQKQERHS